MKRQILIGLGATGALIVVLAIVKAVQISSMIAEAESRPIPPEAVTSFVAQEQDWQQEFSSVGSLAAVQGATLSAEEVGRVSAVNFESGADVKAGDVLVALDTAVEEAQLDGARAQLQLGELNAKRQRALRERSANSQSELDDAEANLRNVSAEVERLTAIIKRKKIVAPFDGRTGIRLVEVGQTVSIGQHVVALNSFEKLYVNFTLPQQALGKLVTGTKVNVKVDSFPDKTFVATLTAIGSQVEVANRNVSLQATLDNPQQALRPGMFADITVILNDVDKVIAIPTSSIQYAPYGNTIYIIEAGKEPNGPRPIRPQIVTLGRMLGDNVAVLTGLKAGEEVVSSGAFKLRPGVSVIVNNVVTPDSNLNPQPEDT